MEDINEIFSRPIQQEPDISTHSLTFQLGWMAGGYYVCGEGIDDWTYIYYQENYDTQNELLSVLAFPENLVAYVSFEEHLALVLSRQFEKFQRDVKGYGLRCYPFSSLDKPVLYFETSENLPAVFQKITWIDDDFLYDEKKEFDFQAFERIDNGIPYLNPKHFSIVQVVDYLNRIPKD